MSKKQVIQVVEYQLLRIGEVVGDVVFTRQHFEALAAFAEQKTEKYFTILHNGVRFANYVGAIQVHDLTIEILPKIDQPGETNVQRVLLDMLRVCRILQPESGTAADLSLRGGTLLEFYLFQFLDQVEALLHQGLLRTYHTVVANRRTLKGKLLIDKQLRYNIIHVERFYTKSVEYDYDHEYNRLLRQALIDLTQLPQKPLVQMRAQQLLQQFPSVAPLRGRLPEAESLAFDRRTYLYEPAVRMALLILRQFQPDIRAGRLPLPAILFDMNVLFEEFIFRQLQKAVDPTITVQRQVRQFFWERRYLQPDILITIGGQRIVLDTKWKRMQKNSPDMDDLRQMFVYCHYFKATRSVLVYPRVSGVRDLPPVPFQPTSDVMTTYFCQVVFIELIKNGMLNHQIGHDLLEKIR